MGQVGHDNLDSEECDAGPSHDGQPPKSGLMGPQHLGIP